MEDPDRIRLRIFSCDSSLARLAYDTLEQDIESNDSIRRTCTTTEKCIHATCYRDKTHLYAEIDVHPPGKPISSCTGKIDAALCVFSAMHSESWEHCRDMVLNDIRACGTAERPIVVVMIEHTRPLQDINTPRTELNRFLAVHRRIGHRAFDIARPNLITDVALRMLFTVYDHKIGPSHHLAPVRSESASVADMLSSFVHVDVSSVMCSPAAPEKPPQERVRLTFGTNKRDIEAARLARLDADKLTWWNSIWQGGVSKDE